MLAEQIDGVIGVDTHRDTLAAAAVSPIGAVLATTDSPANTRGYQRLLDFARETVPGARCWALEGTGSYGAGLAAFLDDAGERVVEVCRPKRPAVRGGRKTDMLDAVRAAREALTAEHPIHPRRRGEREALRVLLATRQGAVLACTAAVNQLKALLVSAPDELRAELRGRTSKSQVAHCARLRDRPAQDIEHRMTVRALRSTAQRIESLRAEAKELEDELLSLVTVLAPRLLSLLGVGPISAAQILVSWSHAGRFRSEAAFASFAGAAPIPASSGLTNRHRLNRSGDRQLNRALHTITLIRMRLDPATRAYVARRTTEGKTSRDAQRCLKRAIARQLFKLLERSEQPADAGDQKTPQAA
ncbi:IS110 family transposase [Embleya sp. NPDC005575]|uniref:IS110 family transposase n=1 Tax=Embleya sp. NPDC005575 TaxID=3156892 RepID=UPI0033A5D6A8